MDPFTLLSSLVSNAADIGNMSEDDVDSMRKALNGTKSITERAKKSFFIYPVLYTPGVCTDIESVMKINKFLEIQYAIFTLMTVGLNPIVRNGDVGAYLNTISTEGYDCKITTPPETEVNFRYSQALYENPNVFNEYSFSKEDINDVSDFLNNQRDYSVINSNELNRRRNSPIDTKDMISEISKRVMKANPSVFDITVYVGTSKDDSKNKMNVPIAIKANPHFIKEEEFCALMDSAIEDKRLLTRIIKLTSGEISFFKDFIFNMDRISRDEKLLVKFGDHPWYRQFLEKKNMNQFKKMAIIVSHMFNLFKPFVSGMSNFLPTATITASVNEIEHGTKLKYGFLLKNDKFIWDIVNRLSLLCINIVDTNNGYCRLYFNGFKKPMVVYINEMSSSSKDASVELSLIHI